MTTNAEGRTIIVNGHPIVVVASGYEVRTPDGCAWLTRIPKGVGAKRRAITFANGLKAAA